ncbi:replication protein [Bacillus sp. FJAT-45037]|uniref:replication protein n=1 Tax=Bacillus sp. FJAT-45037 TaxID=2011007 RepID=UPI000C244DE6|nr:replication protein [Bacillus sp. FJAT-45037]
MVNPQLENGHTRIANEILEQVMKLSLNGTQFRLVLAIWRFTYGFSRKENEMSLSFLGSKLSAGRKQVDRELAVLLERRIIVSDGAGKRGARILSFNKNHDEWLDEPIKEKISIEKKKKKPSNVKEKYSPDNTYYKMAKVFHELVTEVAKDAGVEHLIRKSNIQKWSDDFRKLVEVDGVEDKVQIHNLMKWVTQHHFWRTNVLSAKKFREKYADLAIKMSEESKQKDSYKHPSYYQKDSRDIEIARNKWIANGGNPDEFTF